MKTLKLNFTVPKDVAETLRARVDKSKRSAFVAAAVREKLEELQREQVRQTLIEGYKARREGGAAVNKEWEKAALEGRPRWTIWVSSRSLPEEYLAQAGLTPPVP